MGLDVLYPPRCPVCGILEDKRKKYLSGVRESIFHPVSECYLNVENPEIETGEYCLVTVRNTRHMYSWKKCISVYMA